MKKNYKVGDYVRILPRKPGQEKQEPLFMDDMVKCCGKFGRVRTIMTDDIVKLDFMDDRMKDGVDYSWHTDWLEKVDEINETTGRRTMERKGTIKDVIRSFKTNEVHLFRDGSVLLKGKTSVPIVGDVIHFLYGEPLFECFKEDETYPFAIVELYPIVKKIVKNKRTTIVFWQDGTKTMVRRAEGTEDDEYFAFASALAKKVYGNNSRIHKLLKEKTVWQAQKKLTKTK